MQKLFKKIAETAVAGAILINITSTPYFVKLPQNFRKIETPITLTIIATGYASLPHQTDDTPFITASNKPVQDGIIAANFLDFGTKIRFPELFGDKVFVVEDRMNKRFNKAYPHRVDIWFDNNQQAKKFGVKKTAIEILG